MTKSREAVTSMHEITINRQKFSLEAGHYKGSKLRELGDVPEDYNLWRVVPGGPDELIHPDIWFSVDREGFRFFSMARYLNGG